MPAASAIPVAVWVIYLFVINPVKKAVRGHTNREYRLVTGKGNVLF